jgi:hypothetical protein
MKGEYRRSQGKFNIWLHEGRLQTFTVEVCWLVAWRENSEVRRGGLLIDGLKNKLYGRSYPVWLYSQVLRRVLLIDRTAGITSRSTIRPPCCMLSRSLWTRTAWGSLVCRGSGCPETESRVVVKSSCVRFPETLLSKSFEICILVWKVSVNVKLSTNVWLRLPWLSLNVLI